MPNVMDLRASLGAPPNSYPGVRMNYGMLPAGTPANAPISSPGSTAANSLGCVGCSAAPTQPPAVAGLSIGALGNASMSRTKVIWTVGLVGGAALGIGVLFMLLRR